MPESQQVVEMCEAQPDYEARRPRREFRVHNARPMQEAHLVLMMMLQRFDFAFEDPGYQLKVHETLTLKPENLKIRAWLRRSSASLSSWSADSPARVFSISSRVR